MKLIYYYDAGHGWLAVKINRLKELGIKVAQDGASWPYPELTISRSSYRRGDTVYLEEDNDMKVFMDAAKKRGWLIEIEERESNQIRNFRPVDRVA